ncbi:MAG: MmgE/PrpD family protein, partial [Terriglobia bacterium]
MEHDGSGNTPAEIAGANLTRRSLFQRAGIVIAAAALPPAMGVAAQDASPPATDNMANKPNAVESVSPAMTRLSAYMSEAAGRALPDEVVEKAKQHILDTLAAMASGSVLTPGRDAFRFARAYGSGNTATVVASKILCGPMEAAFTNGMLSHSDETDDSNGPSHSHPGCAVVPGALAAGEQFGISGEHFLRAVTLGYDVACRVTITLGGEPYETKSSRSTHSIATYFGAAAAAGCAASLDAEQMRVMLGYTAQECSGLTAWRRDTQHVQKAFVFAGMTARGGVTAALLVQLGWTGVSDIFSGKHNFFQAYDPQADPAGLIDKLGERYE